MIHNTTTDCEAAANTCRKEAKLAPENENLREQEPSVPEHSSEANNFDKNPSSNVLLDQSMETAILQVDQTLISDDSVEDHQQEVDVKRQTRNRRIRMAVGLFLLAFVAFVITDSLTNKYIRSGMTDFLEWVEENPGGGVVAFIVVVFCTTVLFIPGIILTFGSGYVFSNAFGLGLGVLLGTISVFLGAYAGAVVSFLLGRFLLRDCVAGLTKKFKMFEALDKAMEEKGFRIMVLLRLSPIIYASPYLNYGAGGMSISFWDYSISLFAILPASVLFVFLGASTGSLADSSGGGDSTTTTIVMVIGIIFSVIAIALTSVYARQELRKISSAAAQADDDQEAIVEMEEDSSGNAL